MRDLFRVGLILGAGAFTAAASLSGCAGTPLKTEASTSGIRAAESVGAADDPRAALHLQLAKEALAEAKVLDEAGENEMAASMLLRAESDAELAVVLSRESVAKSEAVAAVARVRELRQSNAKNNNP